MNHFLSYFKRILLFSIVWLPLRAQTPDVYRNKMNSVFANIDRSVIPTGYLSEYAFPLAPLESFDGTVAPGNQSNLQILQMLYATWYSAYIASSDIPGATPATVNTTIRTALSGSTAIPVALLFANYNSLRADAVSNNLLSVANDQLFDVAGRSQSPYDQRVLFAAAPAVGTSRSNAVSFVFNQSLLWGNGGGVNALAIDFGEGAGYQTVNWGSPISWTFSGTGLKRIKVRLTPSSGSVVESHFDLQVLAVDVCTTCRYPYVASTAQPFFANGSHSGGVAFIRFSTNNTTGRIKKPFIVAEGYDVNSVAPLLSENYRYIDFIDAITLLGGDAPNSYDFSQALDDVAGYDIVFIDYNNGTDDIRRNAALVQDVVRWVNGQKQAGDAQNVVMGMSMGGLVTRYALAQMVRNGEDTQTRLLITHDSPHRGANVPLGIQFAGRAAADISFLTFNARDAIPQLDQLVGLYDAPASNQLLLIRAIDGNGTTATNTFLDSDYRSMIDLATPYRTIATSAGSQCGRTLFPPSTQLANFSAQGFLSPIPWISNNRLRTDLNINASADQQSSQLVYLRVYSSWTILSFITINITLFERGINGPAIPFYDGAAGGVYPVRSYISSDFKPSGSFKVLWFLEASYSTYIAEGFCFVPVPSGLDVTNFNASSLSSSYIYSYSPTNPSRLGKFIAQEVYTKPSDGSTAFNETHIRFTARNGQWLYNEMEGIPNTVQCTGECSLAGVGVSGPPLVCTTAQFVLNNAPTDLPITWSVSPSNAVTPSSGAGNVANVTSIGPLDATISFSLGCGPGTYTYNFHSGDYNLPSYTAFGPTNAGCGQLLQYTTNQLPGASSYIWSWPADWTPNAGQNSQTLTILTGATSGVVGVRVGACGGQGGSPSNVYTSVNCGYYRYQVSPNPAQSQLSLMYEVDGQDRNYPEKIELYDEASSNMVASADNKSMEAMARSKQVTLDVSKLPRGRYVLHVTREQDKDAPIDRIHIELN